MDEIRQALRSLWRTPLAAGAAMVTLALALGANGALFALLEVAFLRPLPFPEPERLATIESVRPETGEPDANSAADFLAWRGGTHSFSGLAAWREWGMALTGLGGPADLATVRVTANLFEVLGVAPALGRAFAPDEERPGHAIAVVSHGFWQQRLGGDPAALGRSILLDGRPYNVIGVMPAGFRFPDRDDVQLWTPIAFDSVELARRAQRMFSVIGRLRDGVPLSTAVRELEMLSARLPRANARDLPWQVRGRPASDAFRGDGTPLLLLMAAVAVVLLIGCANVANLMLARGLSHLRSTAVRAALGAGPVRLMRLPLLESAWLAFLSGLLAVVVSVWMSASLLALQPDLIPHWHAASLSGPAMGFMALISACVALGIGVAPAARSWSPDLLTLLRAGEAQGEGRSLRRLRAGLVGGQVALAFVLAVSGLLLVRTMGRLARVDPGFTPSHLLTTSLALSPGRYPNDTSQRAGYQGMLAGVKAIPGVVTAALVTTLPMDEVGIDHDLPVRVSGIPHEGEPPQADFRIATPDYFETLGVPILRGRALRAEDREGAPGAMVINQTMARQLFQGDPVGREVSIPGGSYVVVGVAGDVHHRGLDLPPRPEMFVPLGQYYAYGLMNLLVRVTGDRAVTATAIRAAIHRYDPDQPVGEVRTMRDLVGASLTGRRFLTALLTGLAVLGLLLAAIGVYAVMAVATAQRRREIGVRIALGADPTAIAIAVVREAMRMVLPGLAVGLLASLFVTRLLQAQLFQVGRLDGPSLVGAAILLVGAVLLAGWLPAWRAARVDPAVVLRGE